MRPVSRTQLPSAASASPPKHARQPRARLAWLVAALVAVGETAAACTVCDTATGEAVRAGIFDAQFVPTLLSLLIPFPILAGVGAAIHFGWPGRWRRRRAARAASGDGSRSTARTVHRVRAARFADDLPSVQRMRARRAQSTCERRGLS